MRRVLESVLAGKTICVLQAASGAEALEIAGRVDIDAAVLDLKLPDLSGTDVLRSLPGCRCRDAEHVEVGPTRALRTRT